MAEKLILLGRQCVSVFLSEPCAFDRLLVLTRWQLLKFQLVSCSDDHTVMLWDALKGNHLHSVTFHSAVMTLAWHPEEVSKLMIGEKNGVIHIYNIVSYHVSLSSSFNCELLKLLF